MVSEMKFKKAIIILMILFFGVMIFFTFTSQSIHIKNLPHVKVRKLSKEIFYQDMTGETVGAAIIETLAIPKELYEGGEIYIVHLKEKNGDQRTFAKKIVVEVGLENEDYYQVKDISLSGQQFIIESDKEIKDGDEVFVVKGDE